MEAGKNLHKRKFKWKNSGLPMKTASVLLLYFEHDHGLIVKDFCSGGELICCLKDGIHNFSRGSAGILCDHVLNAAAAKRFIFGVAGVNNAITEKGEYITRLGMDGDFVMGNVFKHA